MSKVQTVDMEVVSELASAIVERQFFINHPYSHHHSYIDENGDYGYVEEVQEEFSAVYGILDGILNPEI